MCNSIGSSKESLLCSPSRYALWPWSLGIQCVTSSFGRLGFIWCCFWNFLTTFSEVKVVTWPRSVPSWERFQFNRFCRWLWRMTSSNSFQPLPLCASLQGTPFDLRTAISAVGHASCQSWGLSINLSDWLDLRKRHSNLSRMQSMSSRWVDRGLGRLQGIETIKSI